MLKSCWHLDFSASSYFFSYWSLSRSIIYCGSNSCFLVCNFFVFTNLISETVNTLLKRCFYFYCLIEWLILIKKKKVKQNCLWRVNCLLASSANFTPSKLRHLQKAVRYHRVWQITKHSLRMSAEAVAVALALACTCSVGKEVFNLWPCHSNASNLYLKSLKNANPLFFK